MLREEKPIELKYQKWTGETWQDSLIKEFQYFTDSTVTIKKYLDIESNIIKTEGKLTEVKNQDNKIIKSLWQIEDNGWENSYEYLYEYQGNIIESALYQEWTNSVWTPIYQGFFEYNDNDNCISELWKYWQNGQLVNSHIYSYEYDENDNITQIIFSFWDENQNLINSYKKSFTYSHTLVIEYKYEKWINNQWENVYKYVYQYENEHFSKTDYYEWQNNEWNNILFAQYTYENDNLTEELWLYEFEGYIYFYARNLFSYQNMSSEEDIIYAAKKLKCYPNPFNTETTIYFGDLPLNNSARLEVYNLKGQLVSKFSLDNNEAERISWNALDNSGKVLPSGIYVFRLNVNGKVYSVGKATLIK